MIHFFTDPYKDELIYSAISRYHFYTGNIDYKDTIEECFGKRTIIPSPEIGSPIENLAINIGGNYTADYLINKHTILPYYIPFLPVQRREQIIEEIKYKDCSGIYNKIGITAGSVCKKEGIYYCSICAKNEIDTYGEAYIHREHQLQGIFLCPHHGEMLKKYKVMKSDVSRLEFIRLDKQLIDFKSECKQIKYYELVLKLSRDAYYLLENDFEGANQKSILEKYKNLLSEKDLATSTKRIKQRELYEEFINFYGGDFLELMESSIDNDDEYNWLRVITRNLKRTVHPIRHLLLINFLEGDIEKFFNDINNNYNPFWEGPWPCLNKAADHYKESVVDDLKITADYKTRVPVGTFTCKCGFVYSRKGPDKESSDRYKVGRIKYFGSVWEEKLKSYLNENKYGLREIARFMGCDPKTILKFDKLLEINYFNSRSKVIENDKKYKCDDNIEPYKKDILKAIKMNPKLSRTEIREICRKQYIYIYRKDKKWLLDTLPQKIKNDNHSCKVDWNKRDKDILNLIKMKYQEMLNEKPLVRITISSIGKKAGILATLEKNIVKLPITKEYLNEIIESVEEFQIRRCKKIIDDKFKDEENIKLWEIQRIGGIRTKDFQKIREEILIYIDMKNNRGKYEESSS